MLSRFKCFEIVEFTVDLPAKQIDAGQHGTILGMAQHADGQWGFVIAVEGVEESVYAMEDQIDHTGITDSRERFYPGVAVRVTVDAITGEGRIDTNELG